MVSNNNNEINIDGLYIGAWEDYPILTADIFTLCNMRNYDRVRQLEQILDGSPIAQVKRLGDGEPLRQRAKCFTGDLTPYLEKREGNPFGVHIMSTSGGRINSFQTSFDLYSKGRRGAIGGKRDGGYSDIGLSLYRKELNETDVEQFKELVLDFAIATDAFYGRCFEWSMSTQREVFMAKAVDNVRSRKMVPDFDCELWDVYWLNYFGPGYVQFWGVEKIHALSQAYDVDRFDNGAICVQTTPQPTFVNHDAKSIKDYPWKQPFYDILGHNTFMHETHVQGKPGQYVPTLESQRKLLEAVSTT